MSSEIRDGVEKDLLEIGGMNSAMVQIILVHPNIAIVDREAELPANPYGKPLLYEGTGHRVSYDKAQQDMLKAGWVKEVKDADKDK